MATRGRRAPNLLFLDILYFRTIIKNVKVLVFSKNVRDA